MRIALVSNLREGKGLYKDSRILESLLQSWGHETHAIDFRDARHDTIRANLTIHLEIVCGPAMFWADRAWWVPNTDWAKKSYIDDARCFERVLCKTHYTFKQFEHLNIGRIQPKAVYTGFESIDYWQPDVKRERRFLHSWAGSTMKGTRSVCRAWQGNYPATFVIDRKLPLDEWIYEMNRCQFWLQPSAVEGFGHCINEGLGVGALVATTDGAPMNELPGLAVKIPAHRVARQNLADVWDVRPEAIQDAARWLWSLTDAEVDRRSAAARTAFLAQRSHFRGRLRALLES